MPKKITLIEYDSDIYHGDTIDPDIQFRNINPSVTGGFRQVPEEVVEDLEADSIEETIEDMRQYSYRISSSSSSSLSSSSETAVEELFEHHETGGDTSITIGQTSYSVKVAQTFTPDISHTLSKIELELFDNQGDGLTGDIDINIYATDVNGLPTGAALDTGTIDSADLNPAHYSDIFEEGITKTLSNNAGKIYMSPDGVYMFIYYMEGSFDYYIDKYYMTTPWDITTATLTQTLDVNEKANPISGTGGIFFKPDGTELYIMNYDTGWFGDLWNQLHLSSAWDLSTASLSVSNISFYGAISSFHLGLWFSPGGTRVYWCYSWTSTQVWLLEWHLSTAWDISSREGSSSERIDLHNYTERGGGCCFSSDGKKVGITDIINDKIYFWNLPTAWTLYNESKDSYEMELSPYITVFSDLHCKTNFKQFFIPSGSYVYRFDMPAIHGDWHECTLSNTYELSAATKYAITAEYDNYEEGVSEPEWVTNEDETDMYTAGTLLRSDGTYWYDS